MQKYINKIAVPLFVLVMIFFFYLKDGAIVSFVSSLTTFYPKENKEKISKPNLPDSGGVATTEQERLPADLYLDNLNYSDTYVLKHNVNSDDKFDQRLVYIDKDGHEKVLVQSLRYIFPKELKNVTELFILEELKIPDKLFFAEGVYGTDLPFRGLYSFDLKTLKFEKLKISEYVTSRNTSYGEILSPDSLRIFGFNYPDPNGSCSKAYVLNVLEDRVEKIITLGSGETLDDGGPRMAVTCLPDVKWLDSNTIEYSVYKEIDRSNVSDRNKSYPLLEKKVIKLN